MHVQQFHLENLQQKDVVSWQGVMPNTTLLGTVQSLALRLIRSQIQSCRFCVQWENTEGHFLWRASIRNLLQRLTAETVLTLIFNQCLDMLL